jgi:carbon monoxide dehydrogenase subunit G
MEGTWNLEVSTPFGTHPATLVLENSGGELTGHVRSQIGTTALSDIRVSGDSFEANASQDFRGRNYTARISGSAEGGRLNGTIKVNLPFAPAAHFTGTRAA